MRPEAARLVVLALSLLGVAPLARAEPEPLEACVARLDDGQVSELLAFTETSLREQRLGAALWFSGWSAFNVTNVSVGAWKLATSNDRVERDTWLMSTIGAGGFLVNASVRPLPALYANLRLGRLSAATPQERRVKLQQGLSLLERAAKGEENSSNLLAHLGGAFFGLFSAGYIVLHNLHGDKREVWLAAGLQLASTVVGAEATLWTVPRKARRDLAAVRDRQCRAGGPRSERARAAARLSLSAAPTYLAVRWLF